jgi:hypothetical protein
LLPFLQSMAPIQQTLAIFYGILFVGDGIQDVALY